MLKVKITLLLVALSLAAHARLNIGDESSLILPELGEPSGQIKISGKTVYSYPQGSIHVKGGLIVHISDGFYEQANEFTRKTLSGERIQLDRTDPNLAEKSSGEPIETEFASQLFWETDVLEAFQISKDEIKPVLCLFVGSDWSVPCKKLENEVLSTDEFYEYAKETFTLLKLDFPKNKLLPESQRVQNESLKTEWLIKAFPTAVVLDSEGNELGRTSYESMSATDFIAYLNKLLLNQPVLDADQSSLLRKFLGDDFADTLDQLEFLNDNSLGPAIRLSLQCLIGGILTFYLIRRFLRR